MSDDVNTHEKNDASSIYYPFNGSVIKEDDTTIYVKQINREGRRKAMGWLAPVIMIIMSIPFSLVAALIMMISPNSSFIAGLFATMLAVISAAIFGMWYTKDLKEYRNFLNIRKPSRWYWYLIGFAGGIIMFAGLQAVASILMSSGVSVESSETSNTIAGSSGILGIIIMAILVPFVVPIVEELFYRGYILSMLQNSTINKKTGTIIGIIVSSIFFGIAHIQFTGGASDIFIPIWTGLIGLFNAILVVKSKSIYPAIILHCVYNGITVLSMILL